MLYYQNLHCHLSLLIIIKIHFILIQLSDRLYYFFLPFFSVFFLMLFHIAMFFLKFDPMLLRTILLCFSYPFVIFRIFFKAAPFLKLIHTIFWNNQLVHPYLVLTLYF